MFYHIKGTVSTLLPQMAVIDCGGVGFALNATANTVSRLTAGKEAKLYTYVYIREDSMDLFGFYSLEEKRCFEMLIGVSGVGPKAALSILSANTPESLALAIIGEDTKALMVAQGIGKKIAQRIILELKEKMAKENPNAAFVSGEGVVPSAASGGKLSDASSALAVLGYSPQEIAAALKGIEPDELSLEEIIRQALKKMMKQ